MKSVAIIKEHSQIRELGSNLKYSILQELIKNAATCQQLSNIFSISKQKVHYNLTKLMDEGLIEITEAHLLNNKEVYYRAIAKNYVLDFSLGETVSESILNTRGIINNILSNEYKINLQDIAANILDNSLRMKPKESLLIVTGRYNLPLVENILLEASRRMIKTTLLYQDIDFMRAKYEEFSLAVFSADYENFNKLLSTSDVYLNLNGESRYVELKDSNKLNLRNKFFEKSREIIDSHKIRVAVMPGLMHDSLTENTIISELQFWQALDVNYNEQCEKSLALCSSLADKQTVNVSQNNTDFEFQVLKVLCESGSFSDSPFQSPVINLPGGEVLILPKEDSMNGAIKADVAYAYGQEISNPVLLIKNNAIVEYHADTNEHLIKKAIDDGGEDGRKVALICMGTNNNIKLENIDSSYKHKSDGLMTVYWGENKTLGGTVFGLTEWFIQLEKPILTYK
jgi:leucyl aminopeptidase (aminopeptidase T)